MLKMSEMDMPERLYRSTEEKIVGGVCGGLAAYFSVDTALVRLIMVVAAFAGGVGIPAYLAAWIIIPVNPAKQSGLTGHQNHSIGEDVKEIDSYEKTAPLRNNENRSKVAGGILVALGVFFLLDRYFPYWFDMGKMWPVLLIFIGIAIIYRGEKK